MKKRIIALACGTCFLLGFSSSCPCYSSYSTDSAKTVNHRIASTQPAAQQVVVAASSATGL